MIVSQAGIFHHLHSTAIRQFIVHSSVISHHLFFCPEEIAQVMGLTSRTVYNTTHMAISSLRERMSKSFLLLVAANLWIFN